VLCDYGEEPLIQVSAEPAPSTTRFDTDEVYVGLIWSRLGQEANEKRYQPIPVSDYQACIGEVLEEQSRHERCSLRATSLGFGVVPPRVKRGNDIGMIPLRRRSIDQLAHAPTLARSRNGMAPPTDTGSRQRPS